MDYHLTIIERDSYVQATVTGTNTPENMLRYMKEAYEACRARGKSAVLLEMNLAGESLDVTSIFRVVEERSADGAKLRKIAYVAPIVGKDPARAHFAETVAVNRGVNVKVFRDIAEAQSWLAKD
jgi:hypothetical protein